MDQKNITRRILNCILLLLGSFLTLLSSPKLSITAAAWLGSVFFLLYLHYKQGKIKWLWLLLGHTVASYIGATNVIPMPLPILLIIILINSSMVLVLYCIYYWFSKKRNSFIVTLLFPALFVSWEYFNSLGDAGTWGSLANTQFTFSYLAQLASITGIFGISFLVYWTNAVIAFCILKYFNSEPFAKPLTRYTLFVFIVLVWGALRYYSPADSGSEKKVKFSGITLSQNRLMEDLFETVTTKRIPLNPYVSPSSNELKAFNEAFIRIIESPDTIRYKKFFLSLNRFNDSLFYLSKKAATKGAQIVIWSEANSIIFPWLEESLVEQGKKLADQHNIYLLMAYAVLKPGKIIPGQKFIENKAILIDPSGSALSTFFKNKPVPYIENSVSGDGKIKVIKTIHGNASISICYDADFPGLMKQIGVNKTDFLLLPSGDWYDISPYHSYMAIYRGIENGCPIIRPTKGGLSIATDSKGKIISSADFFNTHNAEWIFDLPIGHRTTIYSKTGDIIVYLSLLVVALSISLLVYYKLKARHTKP